jgi:hypothetical protein
MEDRIVVSDNGDVWSPKMAPASTAPNTGVKSERSTETTISAAIGRNRPKVPKVLPIEEEMKQACTNKRAGSRENARPVLISPAKYSPIPSKAMISAVIHARNNTAAAISIDLMPDSPAVATWLGSSSTAVSPLKLLQSVPRRYAVDPS